MDRNLGSSITPTPAHTLSQTHTSTKKGKNLFARAHENAKKPKRLFSLTREAVKIHELHLKICLSQKCVERRSVFVHSLFLLLSDETKNFGICQ
jgi:hypothetical protein